MKSKNNNLFLHYCREDEEILRSNLDGKTYDIYKERFMYVISYLYSQTYYYKSRYEPGDYIPLNREIFASIGGDYPLAAFGNLHICDYILEFWQRQKVIEVYKKPGLDNPHHEKGITSRKYRLTKDYSKLNVREFMVLDDHVERSLRRLQEEQYKKRVNTDYLRAAHRNLERLSIDYKVIKALEKKTGITPQKYESGNFLELSNENSNYEALYRKFTSQWNVIRQFLRNNINFSRSESNKRVHSGLTNLSKEFRKFLLLPEFPEERIVVWDTKNSQPLIFNILVKDYFESKYIDISTPQYDDIRRYKTLTEQGQLYEALAKEVGVDIRPEKKRSDFKKKCFAEIFYGVRFPDDERENYNAFKKLFPNLDEVMEAVKGKGKKGPRKLALKMQQIEARIFIDRTTHVLHQMYPDLWFATIHDSVLCLKRDQELVKDVIYSAFLAEGLSPTLSHELVSENPYFSHAVIDEDTYNIETGELVPEDIHAGLLDNLTTVEDDSDEVSFPLLKKNMMITILNKIKKLFNTGQGEEEYIISLDIDNTPVAPNQPKFKIEINKDDYIACPIQRMLVQVCE